MVSSTSYGLLQNFRCLVVCLAATCGAGTAVSAGSEEEKSLLSQVKPSHDTLKQEQIAQQRGVLGYEVPGRVIEVQRGETVENRPRPEFDPLGLRAGSFLFFPTLAVRQEYDSNVFATDNDEDDDFITRILPSFDLRSDWNTHELSLSGGGDIGLYADKNGENYQDYFVNSSGRLDITSETRLDGTIGYEHLHEDRTDPENVGAADEPTEFDVYSANLRPTHRFGRFEASLTGNFRRVDYDNTDAVGGGKVRNHDRDRNIYRGAFRLGYDIQQEYQGFIEGSYNVRDYDDTPDDSGVDRDSNGFEVIAGADLDIGGLVFGEIYAGYLRQSYDDSDLSTVEGPIVGGEITWNVTRLTTVIGSVSRLVRETTVSEGGNQASARFETTAGISVDHELFRNVILEGDFTYINSDYESIRRTDNVFQVGVGARYLLNRNLHISGSYSFLTRNVSEFTTGTEEDGDFDRHLVFLQLQTQF